MYTTACKFTIASILLIDYSLCKTVLNPFFHIKKKSREVRELERYREEEKDIYREIERGREIYRYRDRRRKRETKGKRDTEERHRRDRETQKRQRDI